MPEGRLQRTRENYEPTARERTAAWPLMIVCEFHRFYPEATCWGCQRAVNNRAWRAMHENAAEQLARRGVTANVIEGEQH